jgi:hypothetical protein
MFLDVLKVIGIVIAALIVFVILLIIFILISPIRYKGKIIYKDDKADVVIKVNHIFRLVHGYLYYRDEILSIILGFFGKRLMIQMRMMIYLILF